LKRLIEMLKAGTATLLLMQSAVVESAPDLVSEVQLCAKQLDNSLRLECYDKLSAANIKPAREKLTASENTSSKSASAMINQPPVAPVLQAEVLANIEQFGLPAKIETPEKIEAVVAAVEKNRLGKWQVNLRSGQQWHQTDSGRITLREGDVIYLETGSLGSYFLGKVGLNTRIRVKRVK
jgi:hypothetical protein